MGPVRFGMRPPIQAPRLRRPLVRVGRVARRLADLFPWTPLGLLVGAAATLGLVHFAYGELDLVLLVVGWGAVGLVAVAGLLVAAGALYLKLRTRPTPRDEALVAETGQRTPTGFRLASLAAVPLLQVRWQWESPAGVDVEPVQPSWRGLDERVVLWDRGVIEGVGRRLVVQDAFGLARMAVRHRDPLVLEVRPHRGALRQMPVLTSLAGGDEQPHPMGLEAGDRVELRRYVPGDPARFIHWKVFGRTRKLMVRMPERALTRARRTVAYLVAGADDDATAAAARVAIEQEVLGDEWTFGADGGARDASTVDEAVQLIVRSSAARSEGGAGLRTFLERADAKGPASAVVFVPPRPGPWLEAVRRAAGVRRGRLRVVIGVDGLALAPSPSWLRRVLVRSVRSEAATPAEDFTAVLGALAGARTEVIILDRRTGRQLGDVHRAAAARLASAGKAA